MPTTISLKDLRVAIKKEGERKGRTGSPINEALTLSLACKIAGLLDEGHPFQEALRYGLNEMHIRKESGRDTYRWAMGSYFGTRGVWAKERRKFRSTTKRRPSEIIVEESGQLAFRM